MLEYIKSLARSMLIFDGRQIAYVLYKLVQIKSYSFGIFDNTVMKIRLDNSYVCMWISKLRRFWNEVCYCLMEHRLHMSHLSLCLSNLSFGT